MSIEDIIEALRKDRLRVTDHADEEAQSENLTFNEIFNSVLQGEIIENYLEDKPYPSCLIYGQNSKREPIHSVWGYNLENKWCVLITVYRPDPNRWINGKERRK